MDRTNWHFHSLTDTFAFLQSIRAYAEERSVKIAAFLFPCEALIILQNLTKKKSVHSR
jgi:hypothetical protein